MNERLSSEQWTRFWEKGTPTTFFGNFDKNYDGKIAEFWNSQFEQVPDNGHILDLATGNGALAVLAAGYAHQNQRNLRVTGIDYAKIDPAGLVLAELNSTIRDKLTFHSHRRIEDTELSEKSVDLIISQFGFEYGEPEASVLEASRILRQQSAIALVTHRRGSVIHRQSNDGLKEVDYCKQSDLHSLLEMLLTRLDALSRTGEDPVADKEAAELRNTVNSVTGELHDYMKEFKDPRHIGYFLTNSMVVFRPQFANHSLTEKLDLLRLIRDETDAYEMRMKDLQSAVLSPSDINGLEQLLTKEGFQVMLSEPLRVDEGVFCQKIVARRTI